MASPLVGMRTGLVVGVGVCVGATGVAVALGTGLGEGVAVAAGLGVAVGVGVGSGLDAGVGSGDSSGGGGLTTVTSKVSDELNPEGSLAVTTNDAIPSPNGVMDRLLSSTTAEATSGLSCASRA